MDSGQSWKSLSLFHVEYPSGDRFGKFLAYTSMAPIFIAVSLITLIGWRRDLHTIFYFCGCLLNEISNFFLKSLISQPRPFPSVHPSVGSSGMPSNHAQFMGFFCAYFALFLYIRLNQKSCCRETKGLIFLIFLLLTVVVCYSRVYLLYHTFSQVLVGVTVGGVSAVIWFLLVQHIVTPIFPWISDSWIGHLLMLQDFTHINNIVKFEYINAQNHIRRTKFERPM